MAFKGSGVRIPSAPPINFLIINGFLVFIRLPQFHYNQERIHQGKRCQGKTPILTFEDGKEGFYKKNIDRIKTVA